MECVYYTVITIFKVQKMSEKNRFKYRLKAQDLVSNKQIVSHEEIERSIWGFFVAFLYNQ